MIKVRVPATSANLGPGFDCLGIALSLYDEFAAEISSELRLDGVDPRYDSPDNLFVQGWNAVCRKIGSTDSVHAVFAECDIPTARGLGSSAALYTAGVCAANVLHESRLSRDELFPIIADLEGHPDNAAPCLYGGLRACLNDEGGWLSVPLKVSEKLNFTVLIPDYELSTKQARAVLPDSYPRSVAAAHGGRAILMVDALRRGDLALLAKAAKDEIHEPYRSRLIPHYAEARAIAEADGGVFLISGSGSTCLMISEALPSQKMAEAVHALRDPDWDLILVHADREGAKYMEDGLWREII